jgi:acetyltransferase-like isoleucine patch superfamily enzyme
MRSSVLYLAGMINRAIPETRLFSVKRFLLRLAGARLGRNVRLCSSATVIGAGRLTIGDGAWIGHQVLICVGSNVEIGENVDVGPRVYIGTGSHEIDASGLRAAGKGINGDVRIGDGVWLGVACIILPGVAVGRKAVVAAGAVVIEDVPQGVLVAGAPAKVVRQIG